MAAAPLPPDEATRLAALDALGILDSPPDDEFDALVRAGSLICGVPNCLLSLIDDHRQWIKAKVGLLGLTEAPREIAMCGYTILGTDIFEVPDTALDELFSGHPAVVGPPHVGFYAGVPLRLSDGHNVGTLCVFDSRPRQLDETQREVLRCLGQAASQALESWRARRGEQRANRALQASENQFRRLYEATPAMLHSIDEAGRVVAVTDTWLAKLGYARDEVVGRLSTDFLAPAWREQARTVAFAELLRTGRVDNFACQMLAKDGSVMDVVASSVMERDEAGNPLRSLSVIQDVTLRRRTEQALAEERQRLADLIDAIAAGTWEWNVQTGDLRIDERWAQIVGHTLADLVPTTFNTRTERMHPDDLPLSQALILRHFAGETDHYEFECRLRHRAGHYVWVQSRGKLMSRTSDGRPERMVGTLIDISERKRHEEVLRKSEDLLERTGRIAGVGGWDLDLVTGELNWSPQTYRIYGLAFGFKPSVAEAINFYAPEARPVIQSAVERSMTTGEDWDLELPFIRADGARIWVRATGSAEFRDGRPIRLTGGFQDVTERVGARLALQEANDRVRLATASGRIGIWDWNIATDELAWDALNYRLHGLEEHSGPLTADRWRRRVHPQDLAAAEAALDAAVHADTPYDLEFRVIWPDGSLHHLRGTGQVRRDEAGRALRMVGANWDVTDFRRLAADLTRQMELQAEAAEREIALFRNSPDFLYVVAVQETPGDSEFVYESASPALVRVTGWRPEDLIGRAPDACLPHAVAQMQVATFRSCMAQGATMPYVGHYATPLGGRDYEGTVTPIHHATSGRIVRLVGALRDVTERNQLQAQLSHGEKMQAIGRLSAGVAHDFNNILQSIYGCLELVEDEVPVGTKAHAYIGIGLRSARRGSYLTHHLLSYARKQLLRPETIRLPDLIADVEDLLNRTLGPQIAIRVDIDPEVPAVRADPGQLQTALLNLAINASHAMPEGGSLVISARGEVAEEGAWVVVAVADTGTGMDEATARQAIEPFFTTKGLNGTGLGLSMVHGFAEQSGGQLCIATAIGEGTTVEIRLPAVSHEHREEPPPDTGLAREAARLMIVDDDPDVLETIAAILENTGFAVLRAGSGNQALGLLADGARIDGLVTDYAMPGMNGLDLIAKARLRQPDLPAVLISGYVELTEAGKLGPRTAALHKPFQGQDLVVTLATLLGWERADLEIMDRAFQA